MQVQNIYRVSRISFTRGLKEVLFTSSRTQTVSDVCKSVNYKKPPLPLSPSPLPDVLSPFLYVLFTLFQ